MSGGSYNYLCYAFEADALMSRQSDLSDMADALARLGYAKDAALETRTLLADIRAAEVRIEAAQQRLYGVWRALEWWHSCDTSEDAFRKALEEYRRATPAGEKPEEG